MSVIPLDRFYSIAEHVFFVVAGFVLMILGLGMGVTLVMLPVGIVIGMVGLAMVVGGLFVRMSDR